jgi:uncharacterized cupin superfamily protein
MVAGARVRPLGTSAIPSAMGKRHPHVTDVDELDWSATEFPPHFACKSKRLGVAAGNKRLGCSLYEVAPGKRAFPMHAHLANEEALYVLEGEGTVRIADGEVHVQAGDYVAFPTGQAHQLINTSTAPIRYLCFSTMESPEVALYPDADKIGILSVDPAPLRVIFKRSDAGATMADYFEGNDRA